MTLGRLASHVADIAGDWALHSLTMDKLEWTPDMNLKATATKPELLARFDKEVAEVNQALAAMTPTKWVSNWKFVADGRIWIDDSKYGV